MLHQNDVGHQDTAPSLHLSKQGEKNSHQGKIQLWPLKGLLLHCGRAHKSSADFCLLLQQIAKALGGPGQAFLVLNIPIWPLGTLGSGEVSVFYNYQALM